MHAVLHVQYKNWQCLEYIVGIISGVAEGVEGGGRGRQLRPPPDSREQKGDKMDVSKIMIFCSQQICSHRTK
jgi:hypothetical protein